MKSVKVIEYIVKWLNDYCENSGLNGFVVGVSGGVDSAVTSTLCARTGKKTIAVNMPILQPEDQKTLAEQHIDWLEKGFENVTGVTVDLTPVFNSLKNTLPKEIQSGLPMANSRSRLRMITLYAFAGHHKLLVAGTGNKVEDFGVGFFTKYGDGGVDLSPIADLMKSEVYELGRALGISKSILSAPPTDGLWHDNRSDEDQIGATYDELEFAMRFEEGKGDAASLSPRQKEVLSIYRAYNRANRHKMEPVPVAKIPDDLRGE